MNIELNYFIFFLLVVSMVIFMMEAMHSIINRHKINEEYKFIKSNFLELKDRLYEISNLTQLCKAFIIKDGEVEHIYDSTKYLKKYENGYAIGGKVVEEKNIVFMRDVLEHLFEVEADKVRSSLEKELKKK